MAVKNNVMMISQNAGELKSIIGTVHTYMRSMLCISMYAYMYLCMYVDYHLVCTYVRKVNII